MTKTKAPINIKESLVPVDEALMKLNIRNGAPTQPWVISPRGSTGQVGCIFRGAGVLSISIEQMLTADGEVKVLRRGMSAEEATTFLGSL